MNTKKYTHKMAYAFLTLMLAAPIAPAQAVDDSSLLGRTKTFAQGVWTVTQPVASFAYAGLAKVGDIGRRGWLLGWRSAKTKGKPMDAYVNIIHDEYRECLYRYLFLDAVIAATKHQDFQRYYGFRVSPSRVARYNVESLADVVAMLFDLHGRAQKRLRVSSKKLQTLLLVVDGNEDRFNEFNASVNSILSEYFGFDNNANAKLAFAKNKAGQLPDTRTWFLRQRKAFGSPRIGDDGLCQALNQLEGYVTVAQRSIAANQHAAAGNTSDLRGYLIQIHDRLSCISAQEVAGLSSLERTEQHHLIGAEQLRTSIYDCCSILGRMNGMRPLLASWEPVLPELDSLTRTVGEIVNLPEDPSAPSAPVPPYNPHVTHAPPFPNGESSRYFY